jgi:hypothetical protein
MGAGLFSIDLVVYTLLSLDEMGFSCDFIIWEKKNKERKNKS